MTTSAALSAAAAPLNILVLLPVSSEQRARLEAAAPGAAFTYTGLTAEGAGLVLGGSVSSEQVAQADVIVGNIDPALLAHAGRLKLLQLNSAGYDNYLKAGTLPNAAALASASGAYGQSVSEHLFAMLLGLMKRLPAYRDAQHARAWEDLGPVRTLVGAHVLVLGAGDIGGHFARLCAALGARVTGVRRHVGELPEGFEAMGTMDELPELLGEADVVASFLPSTPATRGLADAAFFGRMRAGSFFVNGGRGDFVDEGALAEALRDGHLAGAALDVTSPEPLPAESPLWDEPACFITPHVSGGFHLPVVLDNVVSIAAENLGHLQAGEPLRNLVQR